MGVEVALSELLPVFKDLHGALEGLDLLLALLLPLGKGALAGEAHGHDLLQLLDSVVHELLRIDPIIVGLGDCSSCFLDVILLLTLELVLGGDVIICLLLKGLVVALCILLICLGIVNGFLEVACNDLKDANDAFGCTLLSLVVTIIGQFRSVGKGVAVTILGRGLLNLEELGAVEVIQHLNGLVDSGLALLGLSQSSLI